LLVGSLWPLLICFPAVDPAAEYLAARDMIAAAYQVDRTTFADIAMSLAASHSKGDQVHTRSCVLDLSGPDQQPFRCRPLWSVDRRSMAAAGAKHRSRRALRAVRLTGTTLEALTRILAGRNRPPGADRQGVTIARRIRPAINLRPRFRTQ
jgi:hypothetical protein